MVEGVALTLDPGVNMWEAASPYVKRWIRDELGPEARVADSLVAGFRLFLGMPGAARRLIDLLPPESAAPPEPPLPPPAPSSATGLLAGFLLGLLAALLLWLIT